MSRQSGDQVSVITGAGSGIGRALALALAERGSALALSDIDAARVEETAELAARRNGAVQITSQVLDVADREAFEAHAERVLADHGHVDLIVNNAGVTVSETVVDTSYEDFEWLMGINFWGVVYGTKSFLPSMLERGRGHIVNISSVFGMIGAPTQAAYNAAKFAVRGFTESLRQEVHGTGVRVSCVHPGGVKTRIMADARFHHDVHGAGDHAAASRAFQKIARLTPDQAARIILRGVDRGDVRILVGHDAVAIDAMSRLLPRGYDAVVRRVTKLWGR